MLGVTEVPYLPCCAYFVWLWPDISVAVCRNIAPSRIRTIIICDSNIAALAMPCPSSMPGFVTKRQRLIALSLRARRSIAFHVSRDQTGTVHHENTRTCTPHAQAMSLYRILSALDIAWRQGTSTPSTQLQTTVECQLAAHCC